MTLTPELLLFFALALVAVGSALGMLLSPNSVHSALFLVLNFGVVAVFFLLLAAPFIALVQVSVYAGAIMVLFLFVIMLLGAERLAPREPRLRWQRPLALLLIALFFAAVAFGYFLPGGGGAVPAFAGAGLERDFGAPGAVGQRLFTEYLLPFELTSLLLLVGMIGAVVLTRDDSSGARPKPPERR